MSVERPRIADVAARAGVSLGTVSHVIHRPHLVLPETQERVRAAMTELGYVPNLLARQLRQGRSDTVGMVVTHAGNPFHADLARAADDVVAASGGVVMVCSSGGDAEREERLLTVFAEQQVRGILLAPARAPGHLVALLRSRGMRIVLLDAPRGSAGLSVRVDHYAGGRLAADHLRDGGCRRIVFVHAGGALPQVVDRESGAHDAARAAGVEFVSIAAAGAGIADGERVARRVIEEARGESVGVFAANDLLAFGVQQGLRQAPGASESLPIVGYDDVAIAAVSPGITTIRQPVAAMAVEAIRLLDAADADDREVVLQPTLVVRGSSGATSHV